MKIAANQKLMAYYERRRSIAVNLRSANVKRTAKWSRWVAHFDAKIAACKRRIAALQKPPVGPTVMYDAVTVSNIPRGAPAVAGYVGGHFPTFPTLVQRFPHARRLSIAVASNENAECLDVEPGDSTPALAPAWVKRQRARGVKRPVIYCSVSSARDVLQRLSAAGIARGDVRLWTAHYTFKPHRCGPGCGFGMPTTADATQWTDKALGRSLDQSLLAPNFWT